MQEKDVSAQEDQAIQDRLAEWQQGDFSLDCGEFLYRDLSEVDEHGEDDGGAVFDGSVVGFAVISQTCDVVRKIEQVPYVSVCPLVKIDPARIVDIEKGQAPRFGLLGAPPEGVVVDFSRTMSVSKQLLLTWDRQRGCASDQEQVAFAKALENLFGRFAFPDAFVSSVSPLRKAILSKYSKDASPLGQAVRSIRELRVLPHERWASQDAVPITFIAILDDAHEREMSDVQKIEAEMLQKISSIKWQEPFCPHEQILWMATLEDLTAADYLNSYPLDVNSLSLSRRFTD